MLYFSLRSYLIRDGIDSVLLFCRKFVLKPITSFLSSAPDEACAIYNDWLEKSRIEVEKLNVKVQSNLLLKHAIPKVEISPVDYIDNFKSMQEPLITIERIFQTLKLPLNVPNEKSQSRSTFRRMQNLYKSQVESRKRLSKDSCTCI